MAPATRDRAVGNRDLSGMDFPSWQIILHTWNSDRSQHLAPLILQ